MAKFSGTIGYIKTEETVPGVWEEKITERQYVGDVIKNLRRWNSGEGLNDNFVVSNQISVVADTYATENLAYMKYIEFMGAKWKISDISIEYPRLVINLGGLYNGE